MADRAKCLKSAGVHFYNTQLGGQFCGKLLSLLSVREFESMSNSALRNRTSMDVKKSGSDFPLLNILNPLIIQQLLYNNLVTE